MGNRSIGIQRGAGQRGFRIAYFKVRREYADRHPIPASRTNEGAGSTPPPCDLSDLTDARRSPSVPSATQLPLQRQVLLPSLSDRLANAAAATRAPSDRGGHVGRTRPAERVDRALEHIQRSIYTFGGPSAPDMSTTVGWGSGGSGSVRKSVGQTWQEYLALQRELSRRRN